MIPLKPNSILKKPVSLLTKFMVLALVLTALISLVIAFALEHNQRMRLINQKSEYAAEQVKAVLNPSLSTTDLRSPMGTMQSEKMDALIQDKIQGAYVLHIRIWNADGNLVYADDRIPSVRPAPSENEFDEALGGKMAVAMASPDSSHNDEEISAAPEGMLKIFAPIQSADSQEVRGAYEILHDLGTLEQDITEMRRFISLSVGAGFIVLIATLFGLVRNASHQLIRQNDENRRLFEEEQARRAELSALYDTSRELAHTEPVADVMLDVVVRRGVNTIDATFACIYLFEGKNVVLRSAHPVRALPREIEMGRLEPAAELPILRSVMWDKEPVIVRSDAIEASESERKLFFLDLAQYLCLVPIRTGDRDVGLFVLGEARSEDRQPFTVEKTALATSIADQAASALQRCELFADLEEAYLETVLALANAIEAKDTYTKDHTYNVSQMALVLGRELGLTKEELEDLQYGSILHDVGKIGIPDSILNKAGTLRAQEWARMKEHAALGARILKPVARLSGAADIVQHHHERFDGKGYPDGVQGEEIHIGARILAVVDAYSAITDRRLYRKARSHEEALLELKRGAGYQFDPVVVQAFLRLFQRGLLKPADRYAEVAEL